MLPDRVARHVDAFNAAVRDGDWAAFAERFSPDAVMRLQGVPVGPFVGHEAIAQAYRESPPSETLTATSVETTADVDTVRFRWDGGGGTGVMLLRWRDTRIAELVVTFHGADGH